jgi:hypothetical protein
MALPSETPTPLSPGASPGISLDKLSPIQQAGLKLAGGVGLVIALVTLVTVVHWWLYTPSIPKELLTADTQAGKDILANYTSVAQSAADQATRIFDLIVSKAFLPIFTTIIGYIFGSRAVQGASS